MTKMDVMQSQTCIDGGIRNPIVLRMCIFATVISFLVGIASSPLLAEETREETEFTYEEFEDNVKTLAERLLASCQSGEEHLNKRIDPSLVDLPPVDLSNDQARRACGNQLNGKELVKSPYVVDYQYEDEIGATIDSFGVSRRLFLGSIQYRLILGWVTQIEPDAKGTRGSNRLTYAEALLFQKTKFGFVQIWSYIDHDGTWDRINQDQPKLYPQFSPDEVNFVHDTWSDKVNAELDLYIAAGGPDL